MERERERGRKTEWRDSNKGGMDEEKERKETERREEGRN